MRPVEQTFRDGAPDYRCFAACIASLLELDLEELPARGLDGRRDAWQEWLAARNLGLVTLAPGDAAPSQGFWIARAVSPRFPDGELHAVVMRGDELVWDPHPAREQGIGEVRERLALAVLDPAHAAARPRTEGAGAERRPA